MSEIGERAEKIWRENSEIIRRKEELTAAQAKDYASLILDVFGASNEQYYISTVIVSYDSTHKRLKCCVQFFADISVETDSNHIYNSVGNIKVMKAMDNVNLCKAADCEIIARIYNLLATDSQVTKYFEVTLDEHCEIITIKMRPEEDVTLDETICENEESEE